jgi:hypothetical protein
MSNWERKSSYLLREIVKFRTYIDSLTAAQTLKNKIYAEREAEEFSHVEPDNESVRQTQSATAENDNDGGIGAPASVPQNITT